MKIYTKTGDRGTTSLYNGDVVSKSTPVIKCLGLVDHLNAYIGVCIEEYFKIDSAIGEFLLETQRRLLDVGSHIATPRQGSAEHKIERTEFDSK